MLQDFGVWGRGKINSVFTGGIVTSFKFGSSSSSSSSGGVGGGGKNSGDVNDKKNDDYSSNHPNLPAKEEMSYPSSKNKTSNKNYLPPEKPKVVTSSQNRKKYTTVLFPSNEELSLFTAHLENLKAHPQDGNILTGIGNLIVRGLAYHITGNPPTITKTPKPDPGGKPGKPDDADNDNLSPSYIYKQNPKHLQAYKLALEALIYYFEAAIYYDDHFGAHYSLGLIGRIYEGILPGSLYGNGGGNSGDFGEGGGATRSGGRLRSGSLLDGA